tara:strand:+ start:2816 stop:3049 length:234 start_codon:yes stop_codon:yes gene_type:complete
MFLKSKSQYFKNKVEKVDKILAAIPATDYDGTDIRNTNDIDKYIAELKYLGYDTEDSRHLINDELESREQLQNLYEQ